MIRFLLACLTALCIFQHAAAHEVRPAYLEITETTQGEYDVIWKQPILDGRRLKLEPSFPEGCTRENERVSAPAATLITRWSMSCDLNSGTLAIEAKRAFRPGLEAPKSNRFITAPAVTIITTFKAIERRANLFVTQLMALPVGHCHLLMLHRIHPREPADRLVKFDRLGPSLRQGQKFFQLAFEFF